MRTNYMVYRNNKNKDYNGIQKREIGKIVEKETEKTIGYIVYDKDLFHRTNYKCCAVKSENCDEFYLYMDDTYKEIFYEFPNAALGVIYHELGHFSNGDLEEGDISKISHEKRIAQINNNTVDQREFLADSFAVEHLGKEKYLKSLYYIIYKRKQRLDDPTKELALKEYSLRIQKIEELFLKG